MYAYFKYFLKLLVYGSISGFIIFLFTNDSDVLKKSLTKKFLVLIGIIYMVAIFYKFGLNLDFLIIYEIYITVIIVALFIFIAVCKKILGKSKTRPLRILMASLVIFFISLIGDAFIWKHLDPEIILFIGYIIPCPLKK